MADKYLMFVLNRSFTPVDMILEGEDRPAMINAARGVFNEMPAMHQDCYFYIENQNWDDGGCMFYNEEGRLVYYAPSADLRKRIENEIVMFKLLTR